MARGEDIIVTLRELIASGAFAPGQRLAEIPVAARLGVSRTPVRRALALLAGEGLLAPAGARGYLVRAFTFKDILDSIEVRGLLEGMAARLVAETGITDGLRGRLDSCIGEGDDILSAPAHDAQADARWSRMNTHFHTLIMEASGNRALMEALARNDKLPFAAAGALPAAESVDADLRERHREVLREAQVQHRAIFDALRSRQGARAEALMREHALQAHRNIMLFRDAIPSLSDGPPRLRTVGSAA
jgi:GntR family transcriptional regulator of vanillate catabolism